jgi:hypothetical protein
MDPSAMFSKLNGGLYPWISIIWKVAVVYLAVRWTGLLNLFHKKDPREPPEIAPKIPIIGHVLGLQKDGNLYTSKLMYDYRELLCFQYHELKSKTEGQALRQRLPLILFLPNTA